MKILVLGLVCIRVQV